MSSAAPTPMMPNVARPVVSGERPGVAGGIDGTRPEITSRPEIAHAGSSCRSATAASVMSTKRPTSTMATFSITR